MLRTGHANNYTPPGFADEIDGDNVVESSWRKEINASVFQPLPPQKFGSNSKGTAESIREYFADYFYHSGAVLKQWKTLYNKNHWKDILFYLCTSTDYKSSHPEFFKTIVPKQLANSLKNTCKGVLF